MNFDVHPGANASINGLAEDALASVQRIEVVPQLRPSDVWWLPKDTPTLTDRDLVSDPLVWLPQPDGTRAFVFLYQGGKRFGLSAANQEKLEKVSSAVLKLGWAQNALSEDYIRNAFVGWVRARYVHQGADDFVGWLIDACERDVIEQTVWAPVQHLAVEEAFAFGRTRIMPLNEVLFDQMREVALQHNPDHVEAIDQFMADFQRKMRGCSAVEVKITAEPRYAQNAAQQVCEDAVGLLRFFSAATCSSQWMSPVALLDALNVPQVHLLTGDPAEGMSYSTGVRLELVNYWKLSKEEVALLAKEDLDAVGGLIDADGLNEFGKAVRSSILAYSRAVTFSDLSDRLVFAFSAIEGLLLRDHGEAIQQNVGERVAFLISNVPSERQAIVENFKKAYRMRSQYIHHRVSRLDTEELDRAFLNIRSALSCAIANLRNFSRHDDFIAALERRKFGG